MHKRHLNDRHRVYLPSVFLPSSEHLYRHRTTGHEYICDLVFIYRDGTNEHKYTDGHLFRRRSNSGVGSYSASLSSGDLWIGGQLYSITAP